MEFPQRRRIVLCEGYHDRASWAGLLEHLNCNNLYGGVGSRTLDPWKKPVTGGHYAFATASNEFLIVIPVKGRGNILDVARGLLYERSTRPTSHLVLCVDSDAIAGDAERGSAGLNIESVLNKVRQVSSTASKNERGDVVLDGGDTRISLIVWRADDEPAHGLPEQQTLERLVCASLRAACPERAECVEAWLGSRHEPPLANVKDHAWSYMAGWYGSHGCEDFYRYLWTDREAAVREQLKLRLQQSGAWAIAEAIAS